jgi:hypothetical protein
MGPSRSVVEARPEARGVLSVAKPAERRAAAFAGARREWKAPAGVASGSKRGRGVARVYEANQPLRWMGWPRVACDGAGR